MKFMAAVENQSLLPEVIEKIALFLPLPDVAKCMRVCRQWKEILSSKQFCKQYVYSYYDLRVEEQPSGMLQMWTEPTSWFCYWDDYEQPNAWVFSVVPKRWKCGIVHLADYDLKKHTDLNYKDFLRALYILSRIQKAAKPDALCLDSSAWGNEGSGPVEVCLFPWTKDALPTSEEICSMFHFHPKMHRNPMVTHDIREMQVTGSSEDGHVEWNTLHTGYGIDVTKAIRFFEWLEKIFTPLVRIGIGVEQMNPIPTFMLAHIAPGWVGGILSQSVCT